MTDPEISTYGADVFSEKAIRKYLSKTIAVKLIATMRESKPLDPTIANEVPDATKKWALDNGAPHLTHSF